MTTLAQARAELITALTTASVRATSTPGNDPPYVLVQGAGIDMSHITRERSTGGLPHHVRRRRFGLGAVRAHARHVEAGSSADAAFPRELAGSATWAATVSVPMAAVNTLRLSVPPHA